MKRSVLFTVAALATLLVASASTASAQNVRFAGGFSRGFSPVVGYGYGYGGFGGYGGYHASTAAEGYGYGAAAVIDAAGNYNLNTSQAAINYQQAYRNSLENSVNYAETYYTKRRLHDSYMESKAGPAPSRETLAERARQGVPERLTGDQYEAAFGTLYWPVAFDDPRFAAQRKELDRLMADREAQAGVGSQHYRLVTQYTEEMKNELRDMMDTLSPTEYVQAKNFLNSVNYEARFVPGAEGLASTR